MIPNWCLTDKFYIELTEEEKKEFIDKTNKSNDGGFIGSDWQTQKYYGSIANCPTCNEKRTTTVSACGCGNCLTCGFRWSCVYYPTPNSVKINMGDIYEDALSHFWANLGFFSTTVSYNDAVKAFKETVDKLDKWRKNGSM